MVMSNLAIKQRARRTWPESLALSGSLFAAAIAAVGSVYLARWRCDPHWLNRGGAAIVAIQVIATIGEFRRRRRLSNLRASITASDMPAGSAISYQDFCHGLNVEIDRSERRAFATVLLLAAAGEILHGFGDLLFETVGGVL
jgi:hypothetical protein